MKSRLSYGKKFLQSVYSVYRYSESQTFFTYANSLVLSLPAALAGLDDPGKAYADALQKIREKRCTFKLFDDRTAVLPGDNFASAAEIYCLRVYFAAPGFRVNPDDVVVDLGANAGVFTTLAALCGKKVIAVEAQSGFLPVIASNLRLNRCLRKAAIEFAIVGQGTGILSDPERRKSASHWREVPPAVTMDDLVRKHRLQAIDFLKIDIEGSEFDLFRNAGEWLGIVGKIAMEVHLQYGELGELLSYLEKAGFETLVMDDTKRVLRPESIDKSLPAVYLYANRDNF